MTLEQTIQETLEAHRYSCTLRINGQRFIYCECGKRLTGQAELQQHLASELSKAVREREAAAVAAAYQKAADRLECVKIDADDAYCRYLAKMRTPECLGEEAKMHHGEFGGRNLDAHREASKLHRGGMKAYKLLAAILARAAPSPTTSETPRRDCDWSRGDAQCPAKWPHDDGHLNCRFVAGHSGKHKTCYVDGNEWEQDVNGVAPLAAPSPTTQREDK